MADDLPEDAGAYIEVATFEQILEMDEEGDREFSQTLVFDFFQQADTTLDDMRKQIESEELKSLSNLGHFLKGSSATLGLFKVRDACEKIQNWGNGKDDTGERDLDKAVCLKRIENILPKLRSDVQDARVFLEKFYDA